MAALAVQYRCFFKKVWIIVGMVQSKSPLDLTQSCLKYGPRKLLTVTRKSKGEFWALVVWGNAGYVSFLCYRTSQKRFKALLYILLVWIIWSGCHACHISFPHFPFPNHSLMTFSPKYFLTSFLLSELSLKPRPYQHGLTISFSKYFLH